MGIRSSLADLRAGGFRGGGAVGWVDWLGVLLFLVTGSDGSWVWDLG